jgi:hypothetical protein
MATLAGTRRSVRTGGIPLAWAGAVGCAVGTGADGLVVGLVLGYVSLAAIGAPAQYLGIPDAMAVLLVGCAAAGVAAIAAGVMLLLRRGIVSLTERLTSRPPIARHPRARSVTRLPAGVLGGLPVGWLAGFAVLMWIVLVGRDVFAPIAVLLPPAPTVPYLYLIGIVGAILALAISLLRVRPDGSVPGHWRQGAGGVLAVVAAGLVLAGTALAGWPGDTRGLSVEGPLDGARTVTALADPGLPGPFAVEQLTYGNGTDARRPAFGVDADLTTSSVDASELLRPLAPGADVARALFWGFGTDRLPIQAHVWLPVGADHAPLVLIVHGNHAMGQPSADGYGYLGTHLASRGFAVASIDEDFLNGSWADDYDGSEQLVRAWLLLVHLDTWRTWAGPAGPFAGRVDLDRVALLGHSRGGEAASVAADLASETSPPRDGMSPWPVGLDVDAVVSIAPSDGQHLGSVRLDAVDFLTLQGGWDADARAWSGIRQYARTELGPDGFAAGMWVYHANHGQFNEVWGATDLGPYSPAILDLASLLPAEDQRDVAKTAIGAFLEVSLRGQEDYRGLFRRPMVGREWLPDDVVIVRSTSGDAIDLPLVSPDPDTRGPVIVTTGATAGTRSIPLRALQPDQGMRGTLLSWEAGEGAASWTIAGLDTIAEPTGIRIGLADGRSAEAAGGTTMSVHIRATAGGVTVRVPLDDLGALPPPLPVRLAKHDALAALAGVDLAVRSPSEIVVQTYEVPLSSFVAADPAFDPGMLTEVAVEVPRVIAGALWITEPALLP